MNKKILGISGSPINDSNTDRVIKDMMAMSDMEFEFIKLSNMNIKPCLACKRCVYDNICKVDDDFSKLVEKIHASDAIIIGGYTPYGQIDGFTKSFIERLGSLRHITNLLADKVCATVLTGLNPKQIDEINIALANTLGVLQNMNLVGQIAIMGNFVCASCGAGDYCAMSGIKMLQTALNNPHLKASDLPYKQYEDQIEVCRKVKEISLKLKTAI